MVWFRSKPISEHEEVPLADDGRFEDIVTSAEANVLRATTENASYVVSVGSERDPRARSAQLTEIVRLVESQDDRLVGQEICHLASPNPRTLLGKGAAQEIAARARERGATMLVVDAELTPSQTRNLEDVTGLPVCDREAVILNVFRRHARTRRARIQVEVARLEFLRPRIRGVGLDMDQQMGGHRYARGPGETMSELMARKIDRRLDELKKALRKIETSGETQRRERDDCKRMALVGYTNAGKTSLMNALTSAGLSARDMPFETLDTTSRCLTRHGGDALISDTVGFVRRLPERLLASFESTLSEIREASLLVVVVDASDDERELHLRTTLDLVTKIGAGDVPRFFVFNKIDRLDPSSVETVLDGLTAWSAGHPSLATSSHDAAAVATLERALLEAIHREDEALTTFVPYAAKEALALVYGKCRVLESIAVDGGVQFRLRGPTGVIRSLRAMTRGHRATRREGRIS